VVSGEPPATDRSRLTARQTCALHFTLELGESRFDLLALVQLESPHVRGEANWGEVSLTALADKDV